MRVFRCFHRCVNVQWVSRSVVVAVCVSVYLPVCLIVCVCVCLCVCVCVRCVCGFRSIPTKSVAVISHGLHVALPFIIANTRIIINSLPISTDSLPLVHYRSMTSTKGTQQNACSGCSGAEFSEWPSSDRYLFQCPPCPHPRAHTHTHTQTHRYIHTHDLRNKHTHAHTHTRTHSP